MLWNKETKMSKNKNDNRNNDVRGSETDIRKKYCI